MTGYIPKQSVLAVLEEIAQLHPIQGDLDLIGATIHGTLEMVKDRINAMETTEVYTGGNRI